MEGVLWFIEGELTDGLGDTAGKRIFCVFQDVKGKLKKINPSVIWDLAPTDGVALSENLKSMFSKRNEIEGHVVTTIMFPYLAEIEETRKKDSDIKRKYGLRSLDFLLQESNDKLLHYQQQMEEGKDMKIVIYNEERRKEDLEDKRKKLVEEIEMEKQLTVSEPKIIGAAAVLPMNRLKPGAEKPTGRGMSRDEEIEQVGMDFCKKYEKDNGWSPEDVHTENLGFDIRSTKYRKEGAFDDIRYVEVKARAQDGAIRISANEWKKAKRFQDKFWLYVVTFAGTSQPKLDRIQNPAQAFKVDEDIYATGYIIPKEKIVKAVSD